MSDSIMYQDATAQEFFDCMNAGELKRLKELIDAGFDLNYADLRVYSPLMTAVALGRLEVVDLLLKNGADINLVGPNYETALDMANKHYYSWRRRGATQSLLVAHKIKAYLTQCGAKTAQELGIMDQRLKQNFDKKDEILFNALKTISHAGNVAKLSQFIDTELSGYLDSVTASVIMEEALHTDNPKLVEVLREKYADLTYQNEDGNTYLHLAAQKGCSQVVQALLKAEVDDLIENHDHQTAFQVALEAEQKEVVNLMLSRGVGVDENPMRMLKNAILNGETSMVHMVLEVYGKKLDLKEALLFSLQDRRDRVYSENNQADVEKAYKKRAEIASYILKEGVDVTGLTTEDGEPLIVQVLNDYALHSLLPDLVKSGADTAVLTNEYGDSPLGVAIQKRAYNLAEMLVLNGADVNTANNNGVTPLMYACTGVDNATLPALLIEYGADIDTKLPNHKNALSLAADEGNFNVVKTLLPHYKNIADDGINGLNYVERMLFQTSNTDQDIMRAYFSGVHLYREMVKKQARQEKRKEMLDKGISFIKKMFGKTER